MPPTKMSTSPWLVLHSNTERKDSPAEGSRGSWPAHRTDRCGIARRLPSSWGRDALLWNYAHFFHFPCSLIHSHFNSTSSCSLSSTDGVLRKQGPRAPAFQELMEKSRQVTSVWSRAWRIWRAESVTASFIHAGQSGLSRGSEGFEADPRKEEV